MYHLSNQATAVTIISLRYLWTKGIPISDRKKIILRSRCLDLSPARFFTEFVHYSVIGGFRRARVLAKKCHSQRAWFLSEFRFFGNVMMEIWFRLRHPSSSWQFSYCKFRRFYRNIIWFSRFIWTVLAFLQETWCSQIVFFLFRQLLKANFTQLHVCLNFHSPKSCATDKNSTKVLNLEWIFQFFLIKFINFFSLWKLLWFQVV